MKYLFFLLIFMNMLLFLWEDRLRNASPDRDSSYRELPLPGTIERITLLSERSASSLPIKKVTKTEDEERKLENQLNIQTEAVDSAPVPTDESKLPAQPSSENQNSLASPKSDQCFQMGPYSSRASAAELLSLIKSHAANASIISKLSTVTDGWWVLIPKAESMEAAKAKRQMLQDQGIRDFWLFNRGELQGAISLGLFNARDKAEVAQKQFMGKNVLSEIVPRMVQMDAYWVKIPWIRPKLDLEEIVQTLNMENSELRIPAPISCNR